MSEQNHNEDLGIKSIATANKEQLGEKFRQIAERIFKWDWIFSTPFEKVIVTASLIWSIYSVGSWIFGVMN